MKAPCELCGRAKMLFRVPGTDAHACMDCQRAERPLPTAASLAGPLVNQHGHDSGQRKAYVGERTARPLTSGEKAHLCILAEAGFARIHGRVHRSSAELENWRREQQVLACGIRSLTQATERHWQPLRAHFLDLAGESGQAFEIHMDEDAAGRRKALALLSRTLRDCGVSEAYAAAICRAKNKCELERATPKQINDLVYTVRNRRKPWQKHAKAKIAPAELPF